MFDPASRGRLTTYDLARFPGDTLFDRIGRAVCHAGCLPRKELYEAWEVARRTRRLFRGGRIVDLAGGPRPARAHHAAARRLLAARARGRFETARVRGDAARSRWSTHGRGWPAGWISKKPPLERVPICAGDVVVSAHACGSLTDVVLARASGARASVAVLPCCHDLGAGDLGDLDGWMDGAIRGRRGPRAAVEGPGLPHLDPNDPVRNHGQEPFAARPSCNCRRGMRWRTVRRRRGSWRLYRLTVYRHAV